MDLGQEVDRRSQAGKLSEVGTGRLRVGEELDAAIQIEDIDVRKGRVVGRKSAASQWRRRRSRSRPGADAYDA